MKKSIFFVLLIILASCSQQQGARRPISQSSGTFMKESVERNKKLVAGEEGRIATIIKNSPDKKYIASKKGYWYSYITQNTADTLTPKKGDIAYYDYEVTDLKGAIIYSQNEIPSQTYYVDKEQNIIIGLRDGIKMMHKNEKVTFLFPSHMAYGYHGDNNKIGHNEPLIYKVTLTNFEKDPNPKPQTK
jgi:gliding motility-associated peptidyl-prolyl isomerase